MPFKKIIDTSRILVIILSGGKGTRLYPLTLFRAKGAVPWGANFRLIDIPMSNALNSDLSHIYVLIQSQSHSLTGHLGRFNGAVANLRNEFIVPLSSPREKERFFLSDADSLVQARARLTEPYFDVIVIMMADQIMKVDLRILVERLLEQDADASFLYGRQPINKAAGQLGVVKIANGLISDFEEKPSAPQAIPDDPGNCFVNYALYAMHRPVFMEMLDTIENDFEPHITLSRSGINYLVKNKKVVGVDLAEMDTTGVSGDEVGLFIDTGTLDEYYQSQMGVARRGFSFDLYTKIWPIMTPPRPPYAPARMDDAKIIHQVACGINTICQDGVEIVSSVLSTNVLVGTNSVITNSVILDNAEVGRNCHLEKVIIEKDMIVPDNTILTPDNLPAETTPFAEIYPKLKSRAAGESVKIPKNLPILSEGGILVFPKGFRFTKHK